MLVSAFGDFRKFSLFLLSLLFLFLLFYMIIDQQLGHAWVKPFSESHSVAFPTVEEEIIPQKMKLKDYCELYAWESEM